MKDNEMTLIEPDNIKEMIQYLGSSTPVNLEY